MSLFGFVSWHVEKHLGVYLYLTPPSLAVYAMRTGMYPNIAYELAVFAAGWMFGVPFLIFFFGDIIEEYKEYSYEKPRVQCKKCGKTYYQPKEEQQ